MDLIVRPTGYNNRLERKVLGFSCFLVIEVTRWEVSSKKAPLKHRKSENEKERDESEESGVVEPRSSLLETSSRSGNGS